MVVIALVLQDSVCPRYLMLLDPATCSPVQCVCLGFAAAGTELDVCFLFTCEWEFLGLPDSSFCSGHGLEGFLWDA